MSNWFYEQWSKIVLWTPKEAGMLSFYIDPDNTSEMMVENGEETIVKLDLLIRRIERAIEADLIPVHKDKIRPLDFVNWAEIEKIELPEEMLAAVKLLGSNNMEISTQKPLITKERESLYKIIRGVIRAKYNYDPLSPTASKSLIHIVHSIQSNEEIHGDTIEAWISRAFGTRK